MTATSKTFSATIYIGLKVRRTGDEHSIEDIERICQEYCDGVGLCVTVTPTTYVYTNGNEPGAAIGLIQYPRFPAPETEIRMHALELAKRLMAGLDQLQVSVVFPDETVWLQNEVELERQETT